VYGRYGCLRCLVITLREPLEEGFCHGSQRRKRCRRLSELLPGPLALAIQFLLARLGCFGCLHFAPKLRQTLLVCHDFFFSFPSDCGDLPVLLKELFPMAGLQELLLVRSLGFGQLRFGRNTSPLALIVFLRLSLAKVRLPLLLALLLESCQHLLLLALGLRTICFSAFEALRSHVHVEPVFVEPLGQSLAPPTACQHGLIAKLLEGPAGCLFSDHVANTWLDCFMHPGLHDPGGERRPRREEPKST